LRLRNGEQNGGRDHEQRENGAVPIAHDAQTVSI
jgi:hypothetical protein